jgi:hypothetical protein
MIHEYDQPKYIIYKSYITNLILSFSICQQATRYLKINNMCFTSLNMLSYFTHVLYSISNHPTKWIFSYAYSIFYNLFIAGTEIKS